MVAMRVMHHVHASQGTDRLITMHHDSPATPQHAIAFMTMPALIIRVTTFARHEGATLNRLDNAHPDTLACAFYHVPATPH